MSKLTRVKESIRDCKLWTKQSQSVHFNQKHTVYLCIMKAFNHHPAWRVSLKDSNSGEWVSLLCFGGGKLKRCYLAPDGALRARRPVGLLVPIPPSLLGKYQAGKVNSEPARRGGGRWSRSWERSGCWRRRGASLTCLGANYSEKQEGAKSHPYVMYVQGEKKCHKIMRRSSLSFTANFLWVLGIWLLSFAGRTDSALGLGRLMEAEASPGNRSKADFRFGVTHIRSLW